jgi:hypothetical protein
MPTAPLKHILSAQFYFLFISYALTDQVVSFSKGNEFFPQRCNCFFLTYGDDCSDAVVDFILSLIEMCVIVLNLWGRFVR